MIHLINYQKNAVYFETNDPRDVPKAGGLNMQSLTFRILFWSLRRINCLLLYLEANNDTLLFFLPKTCPFYF